MLPKAILVRTGEILLISIILGAINLFYPNHPGFIGIEANPFLFFCVLAAGYYGRYAGFLALAASILVSVFLVPIGLSALYPSVGPNAASFRAMFSSQQLLTVAAVFVIVFILGLIRDRYQFSLLSLRDRMRQAIRSNVKLQNLSGALFTVNRELEERVLRQADTLTALYSQVQKLHSANLSGMLSGILETIEQMTGATTCSLWEYRHQEKHLLLAARRGADSEEGFQAAIPVDGTIEGWVMRNNLTFSVQMLTQYTNLRELDAGRNIMTFPVRAGRRVWGVLNIGAMPFGKYNRYTQRLVEVILALVSPSLEKALEYEMSLAQSEVDVNTGLPLISQFHTMLERELYRVEQQHGRLSVIILELVNSDDLREEHGQDSYYVLLNRVVDYVQNLSNNQADLFHYRTENQIAVIYPDLDFDGASFFCLELLSAITSTGWEVNDIPVKLDVIVGYSAIGEKMQTASELLRGAERLLEMQKV